MKGALDSGDENVEEIHCVAIKQVNIEEKWIHTV